MKKPRMLAKKLLHWMAQHKAATAKLLLAFIAISIILFLPLRSEALISNITWNPSAQVLVKSSTSTSYYNFSDLATVVNGSLSLAWSTSSYNYYTVMVPTNITCYDFVRYGAKLSITIDELNLSGVPEGQSGLPLEAGITCGDGHYVEKYSASYSTALGETSKSFTGISFKASYLDVLKEYGETLGNVPNSTLYVYVYSIYSGVSLTATISGGATLRKPLFTAFTEPIAAAFSAIWGAILGFIRRVRSAMNSALGGFWSYFGISAFTGNVVLSLAIAALIIYLVHYKHILRKR